MAKNTGAPKTTPKEPERALSMMANYQLHDIITDMDCSEEFRALALKEIKSRKHRK